MEITITHQDIHEKLAALSLAQLKALIAKTGKHLDKTTLTKMLQMDLQKTTAGSPEALAKTKALYAMLGKPKANKFKFNSPAFGEEVLPPLGKAQELARQQLANKQPKYIPVKKKRGLFSALGL